MPEAEEDPRKENGSPGAWRRVDKNIWASSPPRGKLRRLAETAFGILAISGVSIMVIAAPVMVFVSIFIAYAVGGVEFFGPTLILIWASLVVGFIVVMEKSGRARHFENANFPIVRRLVSLSIAFLMVLGGLTLLLFLAHRL